MAKCVRCGGPASWRLWKLGSDADADMGAYCEGDLGREVSGPLPPWYATPIDAEEEGPFVGGWDIDDTEAGS